MGRLQENEKQSELQSEMVKLGLDFYLVKKQKVGYYDLSIRFGKCKTTIELWKALYPNSQPKILITYPDNKLRDTWNQEMLTWDYTGYVILTNFSSLKHYVNEDFDHFIVDEHHSCSDNERDLCWKIIENSGKTTLLSGTVDEETRKVWGVPCIGKYTTEQGVEDGVLADYQVTVHRVDLDNTVKVKNAAGKLKTEKQRYDDYTWVIEDKKRKKQDFMMLALARNRLSLNSIAKNEYVKKLLQSMGDKRVIVFTGLTDAADNLGIPSYHAKSKSDVNFDDFQSGKNSKLALAAKAKVGVSFYMLDSVVLTNFSYNSKDTKQILQRAIKLDWQSKVADLHVICINESAEIKKAKETLELLEPSRIEWL